MTSVHIGLDVQDPGTQLSDQAGALEEMAGHLRGYADEIHCVWRTEPSSLTICVEISSEPGTAWALRERLAEFAAAHPTCAITWAVIGDAERITPATGGDA